MEVQCFGLVTADSALPLRDVSVEAEIRGYVLGLQSTLKYQNASPTDPLEVQFRFPLEQSHAVVGLTALIDGRKITAEVKKEEEARSRYEDAIASGKTAAFAKEMSGDVFSVSLGNLPPQKEAEIVLQLVGELPIDAEGGVRFSLPATLKPRYVPAGSSDPLDEVDGAEEQVQQARVSSVQKFKLSVFDQENIDEITSPTHSISVTRDVDQFGKVLVTLSAEKQQSLASDLVVLVKHKQPHSARALVEAGQKDGKDFMKQTALMINFFPEFPDMASLECEFIFLVDRSGSMSGSYIESARETLLLFLKSLPEDCHFNIVGFGSRHTKLFDKGSVAYSQATLDAATSHTQQMQADLGGTELLSPLKDILCQKPYHRLAKQVFVLTDGAVSNTQACVDVVKQHASMSRCFTFGIGSGASSALVEGLAGAGNGSAEFIKSGERMQPKVIRSLKRANQPSVTGVSLKFDLSDPNLSTAYQCPEKLPPVFAGEKLVVYGLANIPAARETIEGSATLEGEILGKSIQHTVQFSSSFRGGSSLYPVHRLAAKALIFDWQQAMKPTEAIIGLSVEASVVSSYTAFIAVDEESSEPVHGALQTWDLSSKGSYGSLQMQVDQVKSIMCANISCVVQRGDCLEDIDDRAEELNLQASQFQRSAHSLKRGGGFLSGLTSFFSGLGERLRSATGYNSPDVLERASCSAEMPCTEEGDDIDGECEGGARDEDFLSKDTAATPSAIPLDVSRPTDILSSLIAAQKADGSWNLDSLLPKLLSKTEREVEEACPLKLKESLVVSAVWATLLVLAILEKKCKGQQMEWELLAVKANKWLKRQTLTGGVEMDTLHSCAISFV